MAIIDRRALLEKIEVAAWRRLQDRGPRPADTVEPSKERLTYRRELARSNRALADERLIGRSDLLDINFLERGMRASRAVCRIQIRDRRARVIGHGTGFLVGPRVLLTNQHVLLDDREASYSLAEFDYENDVSSLPRSSAVFRLAADTLYVSDPDLDYALVAVDPIAIDGERRLEDYGYLKLRPRSGKALIGEPVSIIQHPSGSPKQIAARANEVVDLFDDFVRYETDTEAGSSGAPVLSDEWEVVALHHAGVKKRNAAGDVVGGDGEPWRPEDGEDTICWESNEGIRISSILKHLEERLGEVDRSRRRLLREVVRDADPSCGPYLCGDSDVSIERRVGRWYDEAEGYDAEFLGPDATLPLPIVDLSPHDAQPPLLYRHFSVVMSRSRRLPVFTACNIDGAELAPSSRSIGWKTDPRLPDSEQLTDDFYKDRDHRPNPLDRGHLVRRLDPAWGDVARESIDDTFHFTNAALQHRSFNNGIWGRLEDAVLARAGRTILNVYTGPILSPGDPVIRVPRDGATDQAQVPLEYWKVIAFGDDDGFLAAAGFVQSQRELVSAMDLDFTGDGSPEVDLEAHIDTLLTFQIPIVEIEASTGLDFHFLRDFDASPDQLEAERRRPVRRPTDLQLGPARPGGRRVGVPTNGRASAAPPAEGGKDAPPKPDSPASASHRPDPRKASPHRRSKAGAQLDREEPSPTAS